jgi:steroid delta-isomerase-like uncharacterized protein
MNTILKNVVRILIDEAFNKGNLSVLENIIHSDYQFHSPTERMVGLDELSAFISYLRLAFPDIQIRIEDQILGGEKICTRFTLTGTHLGDFLGIPKTGRSVKVQGVVVSRLKEGLIVEEWEILDQLTLSQQLGAA